MFLASKPSPPELAKLDPARSAPDEFLVVGTEIFLRLKTGAAKTRLTNAYFDTRLKTVGTVRNWHTVNTLLHLLTKDSPGEIA